MRRKMFKAVKTGQWVGVDIAGSRAKRPNLYAGPFEVEISTDADGKTTITAVEEIEAQKKATRARKARKPRTQVAESALPNPDTSLEDLIAGMDNVEDSG